MSHNVWVVHQGGDGVEVQGQGEQGQVQVQVQGGVQVQTQAQQQAKRDVEVVFFTNGIKQGSEKLWVDRSRTKHWPSKWLPPNLYVFKRVIICFVFLIYLCNVGNLCNVE